MLVENLSRTNRVLLILCLYGLFKELRPSEPFLTEYLIDPAFGKNVTKDEVSSEIYPVWSYAYFCLLIPGRLTNINYIQYLPQASPFDIEKKLKLKTQFFGIFQK